MLDQLAVGPPTMPAAAPQQPSPKGFYHHAQEADEPHAAASERED